ncbi:MAG: hypothetical protein HY966_05065 [Ignavibacteriales bacterium]|nr:hypothetical protein [Ignavibacteriales bacterium]
MMDYIAAGIIFGVLAFTVARVQININSMMYQNTFNITTQANAVQLARQLEFDFLKMGYHVTDKYRRVYNADTSSITFRGSLLNNNSVDSLIYTVGGTNVITWTANPNDRRLHRNMNGATVYQLIGLTQLLFSYYDSNFVRINTPITNRDSLAKIRAINVKFRVESTDPVYTSYDTTWFSVSWEKLLFPRNLNQLNY